MAQHDVHVAAPPSFEEQVSYYYGLPSRPKLVARSSTDPWVDKFDFATQFPVGKLLNPVGRHPIVGLWNTDGPLRRDIVLALDGVEWTVIDVLRLGYTRKMSTETEEPEHPVTLLISVKTDSTPWEQGHAVVMQCREILQQHGISDVHCEMKEAQVFPHASPPTAPLSAPKLHSGGVEMPVEINGLFSTYLGHSIATFDRPTREGTKCLYLRRKDTGQVLALTCRHVVIPDEAPNEDYTYDESNVESRITVIQPGNSTLEIAKRDISSNFEDIEAAIKFLEDHPRMNPDEKAPQVALHLATLSSGKETMRRLNELDEPSTRIIGHVLFSPKYSTGTLGTDEWTAHRLRDWALIELHPDKHASPLEKLRNEVTVPAMAMNEFSTALGAENLQVTHRAFINLFKHAVELQGTIPEGELKRPRQESRSLDEPAILVAKHGRSTQFTIGLANNVTSVKRQPIDKIQVLSEEWCILGQKRDREGKRIPFSDYGDSGSCIWDRQGRIGGMLTSGSKFFNLACDTTFATPIEWLLEDIRAHGYDVELVSEREDE
ncbi:hypothetical protein BGZ61DRAFT_469636 [Ilyonectria robusta]|uniref:uncharacterized protein n=1 Tax=Ilyonectria robusta TaxID=1079257 RepID=UPI001E8E9980|nr:uncharacterized protein BGZ61DRAFT_469636 [Ilyonectria robusta]KAH8649001.1 hypothetical protein BGZ61DRAFT_469636 [Ilyonectria robusta]